MNNTDRAEMNFVQKKAKELKKEFQIRGSLWESYFQDAVEEIIEKATPPTESVEGFIPVTPDTLPELGQPVWMVVGGRIMLGCRSNYDGEGWVWCLAEHLHYGERYRECYGHPWDFEPWCDDDYQPTHWKPLPDPATHPTPESEGVDVEEVRLRLAEVVRYIDLMHWEIEGDLGALPLVDLLTPDEDESIKRGEDEILNIVDEIVPVVLDMLRQARQSERERITEVAEEVKGNHVGLHNANIALNEFLTQLQGGSDE